MDNISQNTSQINAVKKLIKNLKDYCFRERLPMFCSVCFPENNSYINDIVSPTVLQIDIDPDLITGHLNVSNGFHTIPPKEHLLRFDSDGMPIRSSEESEIEETLEALNQLNEENLLE